MEIKVQMKNNQLLELIFKEFLFNMQVVKKIAKVIGLTITISLQNHNKLRAKH